MEEHRKLVDDLKLRFPGEHFRTQCIFQPVPKHLAELSAAAGGNMLGIERFESDGILFLLSAMMGNPEQEAFAYPRVRAAVEAVREYATAKGGDLPWLYMNYADKTQDVLRGYGADNVNKMKEVAAKYDPRQVFQRLCPGGWKISAVN